jgi:hypothetical protein
MTQPRNPNQKPDPAKPGPAGRQQPPAPGQKPLAAPKPGLGQPARPAAAGPAKGQPTPAQRGPLAARQAQQQPAQPQRPPVSLPVKPVNGTPAEIVDYLGGQIQLLATRLEGLREQGAGNTTEFRALEMMLTQVQDKLLLAQSRIRRGG